MHDPVKKEYLIEFKRLLSFTLFPLRLPRVWQDSAIPKRAIAKIMKSPGEIV